MLFALAGAKADERETLLDMLEAGQDVVNDHLGQTVIGDKNYFGRHFEADLTERELTLLRPARKTPQGLTCQIRFIWACLHGGMSGVPTLPDGQVPDGVAIRGGGRLPGGHAAWAASGVPARWDHAVASSYSRPVFTHPCRMPVSRLATRRSASSWPASRARSSS